MSTNRPRVSDDVWQPDHEIDLLLAESVVDGLSAEQKARQILTQNAPMAAKSVVWLSKYASAEAIRLKASQYILDGVVGGGFKSDSPEDDQLIALVRRLAENDVQEEQLRY